LRAVLRDAALLGGRRDALAIGLDIARVVSAPVGLTSRAFAFQGLLPLKTAEMRAVNALRHGSPRRMDR
jgi:hypothetical protein